jgi:hypothetical protein
LPFHDVSGGIGSTIGLLSKHPIDAAVDRTLMRSVKVADVVRNVRSRVLRKKLKGSRI